MQIGLFASLGGLVENLQPEPEKLVVVFPNSVSGRGIPGISQSGDFSFLCNMNLKVGSDAVKTLGL